MVQHGNWKFWGGNLNTCGGSRINGVCGTKFTTLRQANAFCLAGGARLCTSEELLAKITKGSGCELDDAMVWSSTQCHNGVWVVKGKGKTNLCDANNPQSRYGARCCADGPKVYRGPPTTLSTTSTTTATFTTTTSSSTAWSGEARWDLWRQLPTALGEVSSAIVGDNLYVLGEGSRNTFAYNLNQRDGEWLKVAQRPIQGHHHAVATLNGDLFLIGGIPVSNKPGDKGGSKVQVYSPTANRWVEAGWPDVPYGAYLGAVSAVVMDGRIRVCGGLNFHPDALWRKNSAGCAVLDPATRTWSMFASLPVAVNHQAAGTNGDKMYIFGGRMQNHQMAANGMAKVQIYDPATNQWTLSKEKMLFGRGGHGYAPFILGHFYIFGGEETKKTVSTYDDVYPQVHAFDPSSERWTKQYPDMPVPVHGCYPVADTQRGLIYVVGGGTTAGPSASKIFQVFTVGTKNN